MNISTLSYRERLIKTLVIMKLIFLLTLLTCFKVSASVYAQTITLNEKNAPLAKVFQKIEQQSGYSFFYDNELLKQTHKIDISVKDAKLTEVLDRCFSTQPLTYDIVDNTIVVKLKEKSLLQKVKDYLKIPINIKGRVTDSSGVGLSGAIIRVRGTDIAVATDATGGFELYSIDDNSILIASFVGFVTEEITIKGADHNNLIIVIKSDVATLESVNVVSTGYQTIPKERATGSFAQPNKNMYDARVSTDVLTKLNGITSGLIFNSNTSAAKAGQLDINIRGRSTIYANDQPLIVVDNFPYSGDINNINPNDVESITVLKDAAAASIWGVRAGNGVIIITTKKGKSNQPLNVTFNANVTVFDKPNLDYNPNQLSASSYIDLEQFLFNKGTYDANLSDPTIYPVISPAVELMSAQRDGTISGNSLTSQLNTLKGLNINDQIRKYLYRNAINQQYALSLSGGSDKASYYFSGGYDKSLPTAKGNSNQRITLNTQNTFYPTKNLEFNLGLNVIQTNNKVDNTLIQTSGHYFPYSQIVDIDGNPLPISMYNRQSYIANAINNGFLDWSYYPLKEMGGSDNVTKNLDFRVSTGLKYTILKGLTGDIKYQYQRSNPQNRDFESQQTFFTRNLINQFSTLDNGKVSAYNIPLGGILRSSNSIVTTNNLRGQLSYNRIWKDHSIAAIAGYEFSEVKAESNSSLLYGYNDELATFTEVNPTGFFAINPSGYSAISSGLGITATIDRIRSSFANVAYTYKDRYTISGSARKDGSNFFGVATNQKNLPLWSIGGKWDLDKEAFYKVEWLPLLKLRATFGYNGNLDRSLAGVTTFYYLSNAPYTNLNYANISNIGNPELRWEKTRITNLALDFGFNQNLISGSFEYYFKKESDLLGFKPFATNTGITSLQGNYSDMKGHGFDLSLASQNLNGRLKWSTTFLISHATDKVTKYDIEPNQRALLGADGNGNLAIPNVGRPVFALYAYKWSGLDSSTGDPIGFINGEQSKDYNGIVTNTLISDLVYYGSARPTYFGGINNSLLYKGFTLNVQINYKLGYYFRNPTMNYSGLSNGNAVLRGNRDYNNRWMKSGDEKNTNIPSMVYPFDSNRDTFYQNSEVNVEKGDHVRLQDISIGYEFNKSTYRKLPFKRLQIFAYGNNIGILWRANHRDIDPDAVPGSGDITTMPNPRSVSFGLKGSF